MHEHRYQLSDRIMLAFTRDPARPDARPHVWIEERPGPDGAGGQVHLTADEWDRLTERAPHLRTLAE